MEQFEKPTGSYISFFSNKVKQYGGINLAQGIPGFNPPAELIDELSSISHANIHQYAPGLGNRQLLELIAERYAVGSDNLLVVQGATEGLSLIYTYLLKLIGADFSVLAFDPAYESYSKLPEIFGQPFVAFPLNDEGCFDTDELSKAIVSNNVKLFFVSSPGNPYGKIFSKAEVDSLIELSNRLGFYLIFDAVYDELYFNEPPYIPAMSINERLFIVSSFSKSLCITGWRIGYILHNKSHAAGLQSVHDYIGLCAPSLLQQALANYLAKNNYANDYREAFRRNIAQSFLALSGTLRELDFEIPKIDGGCFIWAKLPSGFTDGFRFASMLYHENKVAVIPGEHFSPNAIDWVRFNIARPMNEISAAQTELVRFIQIHRG
ncbi:MAG: pyridoxal phosphate-dependent aminotransferase [Bacteroidales bacterium]|nr:pyridoxal phosphate-dependent aminotransferase [Bacteroidales bacterium]